MRARLTRDGRQNLGRFLCIREELRTKIKQQENEVFSWWYTKVYGPISDYELTLIEHNKAEWMHLKNLAVDLENKYREAVGEDNHEALQEVGLSAPVGDTLEEEVVHGEEGVEADDKEATSRRRVGIREARLHGDVMHNESETEDEDTPTRSSTADGSTGRRRETREGTALASSCVSGGNMGLWGTALDGSKVDRVGAPARSHPGAGAGLTVSGANMGSQPKQKRYKTIKSKTAKESMRAIERFV